MAARALPEIARRFAPASPIVTFAIRFHHISSGSAPTSWLSETKIGDTLDDVVEHLTYGHLDDRFTLAAVYEMEMPATGVPGTILDVTGDALRLIAARCDADRIELPRNLGAAFDAHSIPAPMAWVEGDGFDVEEAA